MPDLISLNSTWGYNKFFIKQQVMLCQ